jgi:hypothetical protein
MAVRQRTLSGKRRVSLNAYSAIVNSQKRSVGIPFDVGDRALVTGGYEQDPDWLQGGEGYVGTITEVRDKFAIVELDTELTLPSLGRADPRWRVWGRRLDDPDRITSPSGKWLLLRQGWVGSLWNDPTDRLHVVLCRERPTIVAAESNLIYGAWVEGHAVMRHASSK